jgi:hypothetical protein
LTKKRENDETSLYFLAYEGIGRNVTVGILLLNRAFYLERSGEQIGARLNGWDSTER